MNWTATIDGKSFNNGVFEIHVTYTNGIDTFGEAYAIRGVSDAENEIINRLSQLNSVDLSKIKLGSFASPSPVIPVPPTQDEIDKQNYFTLLSKWETAKADIDKGLLDKSNSDFLKLESDLKSAYKSEYSGL